MCIFINQIFFWCWCWCSLWEEAEGEYFLHQRKNGHKGPQPPRPANCAKTLISLKHQSHRRATFPEGPQTLTAPNQPIPNVQLVIICRVYKSIYCNISLKLLFLLIKQFLCKIFKIFALFLVFKKNSKRAPFLHMLVQFAFLKTKNQKK